MKEHELRVIQEQKDLDEKIVKLEAFITSNKLFIDLDQDEQIRLKSQLDVMKQYASILEARIVNFKQ